MRPVFARMTWPVDCDRETRAIVMMAAGFVLRGADFISWKNQTVFHEMTRFPLFREGF